MYRFLVRHGLAMRLLAPVCALTTLSSLSLAQTPSTPPSVTPPSTSAPLAAPPVNASPMETAPISAPPTSPTPAASKEAPASGQNALPALVVTSPKAQEKPALKPTRQTERKTAPTRPLRAARIAPRNREGSQSAAPALAANPNALPVFSRWSATAPDGKPAFVERFQLPGTLASVTQKTITEKINVIDTEDAVKYLPSLMVRKRNDGDTQAVLATRTWGVNSSARTLVYADDLLLTALIGNDNTIGAPRWGLVAPNEIERVDFLYGPFSAAYPGNSMGGVLQITTRMPEKLEITAQQTESLQTYNLWNTNRSYWTHITSASAGAKTGDLSWYIGGNFMDNRTQPLTFVTAPSAYRYLPPGAVQASNKIGNIANIFGAMGELDQQQVNGKLKLAYDFTPTIRASYQLGIWSNDSSTQPDNYLTGGDFPGFGAPSGPRALPSSMLQSFGGGNYRIQEKMLTNAGAIKSNSGGLFDFEISASNFSYLQSDQKSPFSALAPVGYTQNGKVARLDGTYWNLYDAKGIWRPNQQHDVSFGVHADEFHLNNPTWLTSNWASGINASIGVAASIAQGTTRTQALWAQDAWRFHPDFKLTLGGRYENWAASDGYNQSLAGINATGTAWSTSLANVRADMPIIQPGRHSQRFSPKGSLEWTPDDLWKVTGSIGLANRFPTVRELYNLSVLNNASGLTANPNPYLRPEVALTEEIAVERKIGADGMARISLFNEEVRDAILAQNIYVAGSTTGVSANSNIDRLRNRGVELAIRKDNFLIERFELAGSVTYVDSRILADSNWAGGSIANNDAWNVSPVGKNANYVPKWRWTMTGTYRPDDHWSFSAAARWQDRMWSTISNNDTAHGVYGAFDRFFVMDVKANYKMTERASFAFGIDNIGNYKYFLFHPFPQRTFTASGKIELGARGYDEIGIFRNSAKSENALDRLSAQLAQLP